MATSTTYEKSGATISWTWHEQMEISKEPSVVKVNSEDSFLEEIPNWQVYDTAMECIGYMGYTVPYSSSSSIISKAQSNSIHKSKSKQLAQLPWEVKKQSRSSQFFFKKGNEHMEAGKQLY